MAEEAGKCLSRPARGAWVEIGNNIYVGINKDGRAPQGARGLKSIEYVDGLETCKVAPRKGRVG